MTPPKCRKLPSSIPKTTHVKFWATSSSLSTTLWCYYRGHNIGALEGPDEEVDDIIGDAIPLWKKDKVPFFEC